jgi:hypothetical protein
MGFFISAVDVIIAVDFAAATTMALKAQCGFLVKIKECNA